jgi:hypothetical protein
VIGLNFITIKAALRTKINSSLILKTDYVNLRNLSVKRFVDKSTEIYPMYKDGKIYAAIQNGDHLFYEK